MNTTFIRRAAVFVVAAVSVCAWAGDDARVRPEPPSVRSVDAPGTPAAAAVAQTWISTPVGVVRVREDASDAGGQIASVSPRVVTVTGPDGQLIRVMPGVPPNPAAAPAALPIGAVVVDAGGAKLLRIPGVADGLQAPAEAPPRVGVRIVDLPPGAVAPVGMPEPRTLYRVTPGPAPPPPVTRKQ